MKKFLPISLFMIIPGAICAQESVAPTILSEIFAQKVSPNGKYIMAQDFTASAILYDMENGKQLLYEAYYPGNGNCVSNNGIMVGQDMATQLGSIMVNGTASVPRVLNGQYQSTLDAITPDGSRACGWIQNTRSGLLQIPFYCDIDENGNALEPEALPFPPKDLLGDTPQFATATYISDDGKTIAGIVRDGTGFISYPIVYTQDEKGDWSYVCPSEPLFNPEHLEIPSYPDYEDLCLPDPPKITDYMSEEMKKEWEAAMAEYEATGDEYLDPWTHVEDYTGELGYEEYTEDSLEYYKEANKLLSEAIDEYWKKMAKISKYARFAPNMALSPDGKTLMAALGISDDEYLSDESTGYITYKFDLSSGEYSEIISEYDTLIPTQVMDDGTFVAIGAPNSLLAYRSYIVLPGTTEFISFDQYIEDTNPQYLSWVNNNLDFFGSGVVSGILSFSKDMSVIVGGLLFNEMMSYVITDANAGMEKIMLPESEIYKIYNLSGIPVLSTKDKTEITHLPKGIYIINGKKIKL
ncbi:MAG: hypothetical protein J1E16_01060 [Muribaculaceae bacterium]|nr:hypothetical protein [Muribaculaceae bacterium]